MGERHLSSPAASYCAHCDPPRALRPPRLFHGITILVLVGFAGCSGESPPASQPTPPDDSLTLLAAGWDSWTASEAVEKLTERSRAVSAALRLIRIADIEPLCAPRAITDRTLRRLRVLPLDTAGWALGFITPAAPTATLAAPVLLASSGTVHRVTDGVDEEALVLYCSDRPHAFPRVLIAPQRVWLASIPPQLALTLHNAGPTRFTEIEEEGHRRIAILCTTPAGPVVVARYVWDGYEGAFAGPASDRLPVPPGGKFQLDLGESPLLVPVGGDIPDPASPSFFPPGIPIFLLYHSPDWR